MFTREQWRIAVYPFEEAECGWCMTQHWGGFCAVHPEFRAAMERRLGEHFNWHRDEDFLDEHAVTILKLRAEFDHLYPQKPSHEPTVVPEPVLEEVNAT